MQGTRNQLLNWVFWFWTCTVVHTNKKTSFFRLIPSNDAAFQVVQGLLHCGDGQRNGGVFRIFGVSKQADKNCARAKPMYCGEENHSKWPGTLMNNSRSPFTHCFEVIQLTDAAARVYSWIPVCVKVSRCRIENIFWLLWPDSIKIIHVRLFLRWSRAHNWEMTNFWVQTVLKCGVFWTQKLGTPPQGESGFKPLRSKYMEPLVGFISELCSDLDFSVYSNNLWECHWTYFLT